MEKLITVDSIRNRAYKSTDNIQIVQADAWMKAKNPYDDGLRLLCPNCRRKMAVLTMDDVTKKVTCRACNRGSAGGIKQLP